MRLNWPLVARAGRRLLAGKYQHIHDLAHHVDIISPEETTQTPAAIYPDGALDKIKGLSPWRNWDGELALINGGAVTHAAARAFSFENATVSGPYVYKGAARHYAGYGKAGVWDRTGAATLDIPDATLVSCISGSAFFGPLLKDSFPQEVLAGENANKIAMQTKAYRHESGYRQLLGLPAPRTVHRARIGRLTFYEDFGQTASRAARYKVLHDRLRHNLELNGGHRPTGVYLKRGATGESRILTNEDALENHLITQRFDVVEPAILDAQEIARRTLDAPLVISVEGSHMAHVVYSMHAKGTMLVLQPPNRFAMAFKEFTDRFGMTFAFVVGRQTEGGFDVDIDELQRLIDQLIG